MKQKFIALLVVMAALFTVFCSGSFAAERDSISVNGHASAEVAPDMATLYGNLETVIRCSRNTTMKRINAGSPVMLPGRITK